MPHDDQGCRTRWHPIRLAFRSFWSPAPVFPGYLEARMDLHLKLSHSMPQSTATGQQPEYLFTNKLLASIMGWGTNKCEWLENVGGKVHHLKWCMALLYGEECSKLLSKIYAVLSAHRLAVSSQGKIWFCGVGISLMTQKDQSCSDFYLLFLFPTTSSTYQKKKQILKLFLGLKKKKQNNCSMFTYIL